jgi:hypothetical protein
MQRMIHADRVASVYHFRVRHVGVWGTRSTHAVTREHVNRPHALIVQLQNILISTPCPFQIQPSLPHIQINPYKSRLNRTNILHNQMPVTLEGYVHIKKLI